jgi:hypothetical protein
MKGLAAALKGISGEFEITRVVSFIGGMSYIAGANVFVFWNLCAGREFDLVAYCAAFPAGLAAVVGAAAGSAAWKDKGVASAKVIEKDAK